MIILTYLLNQTHLLSHDASKTFLISSPFWNLSHSVKSFSVSIVDVHISFQPFNKLHHVPCYMVIHLLWDDINDSMYLCWFSYRIMQRLSQHRCKVGALCNRSSSITCCSLSRPSGCMHLRMRERAMTTFLIHHSKHIGWAEQKRRMSGRFESCCGRCRVSGDVFATGVEKGSPLAGRLRRQHESAAWLSVCRAWLSVCWVCLSVLSGLTDVFSGLTVGLSGWFGSDTRVIASQPIDTKPPMGKIDGRCVIASKSNKRSVVERPRPGCPMHGLLIRPTVHPSCVHGLLLSGCVYLNGESTKRWLLWILTK